MITVELEGPNGPKIIYPTTASSEEVDNAAPDGWEVDWVTTPADCGLHCKASPLRRTGATA
jgi:hypothetical protein